MRTDSVQLSQEAIGASRQAARDRYGEEYVSKTVRRYKAKVRNAQEAHEAIRPAGNKMPSAQDLGLADQQATRLYDLIWKRTVASQMADARLRQVSADIEMRDGEGLEATFRATGQQVLFPGFMRAYVEGADDPQAALAKNEKFLPELVEGDQLPCHEITARSHQTKPPARYTEASLIQRLEQEGIGRPSTYAEVMDKVQRVGYAQKVGRTALGATFTAFASNNLMESGFKSLVDTGFTAALEEDLDNIASGARNRSTFLQSFYRGEGGLEQRVTQALATIDRREISVITSPQWGNHVIRVGPYGPYMEREVEGKAQRTSLPDGSLPSDVTKEQLDELWALSSKPGSLSVDPETGEEVFLKQGRYGRYCQVGPDADGGNKPKRVSIPKSMNADEVTLEVALKLLALPTELGVHPETGKPISVGIGRYGPYVRVDRTYASLRKEDDLFTIGLDRAVELLEAKKPRAMQVLGKHPETGSDVSVGSGRYGPYVKHGRTNASLQSGMTIETVTLEEAVALVDAKDAKGGTKRRRKKSTSRRRSRQ